MTPFAVTMIVSAPGDPLAIEERHAALRYVLVRRDRLHRLDHGWHTSGVYVRLSRAPEGVSCYVGQAGDLIRRLEQHADDEQTIWSHALLIAHGATPYDESEYTYLEGAVHDGLANGDYRMANIQRPGSDRLSNHEKASLDEVAAKMVWLLAGLGWAATDGHDPNPVSGGFSSTGASGSMANHPDASRLEPHPDQVIAELAPRLQVARAPRGSVSPSRALLLDGLEVGGQISTGRDRRVWLSAEAVEQATAWRPDVVRAGLGAALPVRNGETFTAHGVRFQDLIARQIDPSTRSTASIGELPKPPADVAEALDELFAELHEDPEEGLITLNRFGQRVRIGNRRTFRSGDAAYQLNEETICARFGWSLDVADAVVAQLRSRQSRSPRTHIEAMFDDSPAIIEFAGFRTTRELADHLCNTPNGT